MNVLHVSNFLSPNLTAHLFALLQEQKKQGLDVRLLMFGYPSYQVLQYFRQIMQSLDVYVMDQENLATVLNYLGDWSPGLIHAHTAALLPLAAELAATLNVPFAGPLGDPGIATREYRPFLERATALIGDSSRIASALREFSHKVHTVPIGLDLLEYRPGQKAEPIKVTLLAQIDRSNLKGCQHFCKAADILDDVDFYIVSNRNIDSKTATFMGTTPAHSQFLSRSDIVAGSGRAAAEALATGNAVLVLGATYQGILTPEKVTKHKQVDLSGLSGSEPCYKNIFFDLAKLTQNRIYLRQLQAFSRELAEKEFDLCTTVSCLTVIYKKMKQQYAGG